MPDGLEDLDQRRARFTRRVPPNRHGPLPPPPARTDPTPALSDAAPPAGAPAPASLPPPARRSEAAGRTAIKVFLDADQVRELLRRQAAGVINRQPITVSAMVREAVRRYLEG